MSSTSALPMSPSTSAPFSSASSISSRRVLRVLLVIALSVIFNRTHMGISLRAVADNQLAAQSVGIRLDRIWRIVWTVAGFVGLVAGLLWGAREGVQFSLSLIVLKALAHSRHRRVRFDRRRHSRRP